MKISFCLLILGTILEAGHFSCVDADLQSLGEVMSKIQSSALPNIQHQWDVAIYNPGNPLRFPNMSTPARQQAVGLENAIRADATETGAFFDARGKLITKKVGTSNHVHFDQHELAGTKGSLFTHNHPDGFSFSLQDVEFAVDIDLIELRAVTTYCRHVLQPNGNWPSFSTIEQAMRQHAPAAHVEVTAMVQACKLSNGDIPKEFQHRLWVLVSNDLNLKYSREAS